jgi:hypothetical protein
MNQRSLPGTAQESKTAAYTQDLYALRQLNKELRIA